MLGKGREIADKLQRELAAVVIGYGVQEKANELIKCGADKVFMVNNQALTVFQTEPYLSALHSLVVNYKPEIVLIGSTRNGKPLAARLATRLKTGCIPDCNRLSVDEQGRLICERITYGGNALAKITFKTKPQIATIPKELLKSFNQQTAMDK